MSMMAYEEEKKPSPGVQLFEVKVKVVGGELEVIQEFNSKLKLECAIVGNACRICCTDGKRCCLGV